MTLYNAAFEKFNHSFISSATLSILVQSCLGGAAAMTILANGTSKLQMIQLAVVVLACILANTSILAQLNHKLIFKFIGSSIIISILLLVANHFFI
ncbi:hypothetical protein [Flavobacterium agrisoli]|uniref:Uncharacterized protein n=1 Tax=Flavobacterium agrisoli TaxID=2793066 RepID=A0A934PR17_9FLAO|nr:hypothetical protein [Flavobacterium agrisoli]MBK0371016.1 hypothetical protein [Flavobacterium agrisoli]